MNETEMMSKIVDAGNRLVQKLELGQLDYDGKCAIAQWNDALNDCKDEEQQNTALLKENGFLKQENKRLRSILIGENECFCLCSDCAEGNHCQVAYANDGDGVIGDCFVK